MGIVYFNVFVLLLSFGLQGTICDEADLYHNIFGTYEPKVRPRHNPAEAVEVELEFELNSINGIDEINQVLDTSGFVVAKWTDDYLKWNPDSYGGIEHVVVPASSVWLPDFGIVNSASTFYDDIYFKYFRVDIQYTGRVIWAFGGLFTTSCEIEVAKYPFDSQSCSIEIENWTYTAESVNLTEAQNAVHLENYTPNGQWDIVSTSAKTEFVYVDTHPGKPVPKTSFTLNIDRKYSYYTLNIVLPIVFVTLCTVVMFVLPPESGERIGLSVTILLAFAFYQLLIADNTPKTSKNSPALTDFVTYVMGLATASTVLSILSLYIHHKGAYSRMSNRLRAIMVFGAKVFCLTKELPDSESLSYENSVDDSENTLPEKKSGGGTQVQTDIKLIASMVKKMKKKEAEKDREQIIIDEWKVLSKVTDLFLMCVLIVLIVIYAIVVFTHDLG